MKMNELSLANIQCLNCIVLFFHQTSMMALTNSPSQTGLIRHAEDGINLLLSVIKRSIPTLTHKSSVHLTVECLQAYDHHQLHNKPNKSIHNNKMTTKTAHLLF